MFTEGVLLLERVAARPAGSRDEDGRRRRSRRSTTPTARSRHGWRAAEPRAGRGLRGAPAARPAHRRRPLPAASTAAGACSAAGTSSSPAPRAPSSTTTGKVARGTFRTAAERLDAVAAMGFDVIYLPPIHPIGEVNRKGPNNTLTPGPDDVGLPVGDRLEEGRPRRRSTPTSARSTTSTRSSARRRARPRGGARPRPAGSARPSRG